MNKCIGMKRVLCAFIELKNLQNKAIKIDFRIRTMNFISALLEILESKNFYEYYRIKLNEEF